jgi:hypothetical protein
MDTKESSASARPSPEEPPHDLQDDIEAHCASLERLQPCACIDGWVFVGYIDEYGEEREDSYTCSRCADSLAGNNRQSQSPEPESGLRLEPAH